MKTFTFLTVLLLTECIELFAADKTQALSSAQRRGMKVIQVENSIYRFEYPEGKTVCKNLGEYRNESLCRTASTIDTTTIDLTTIDTSLYYSKYKFWQEIDVSDADFNPIVIGDVNNNERAEIYGFDKQFDSVDDPPNDIFELDSAGAFKMVYEYPDTPNKLYRAQGIFDVEGNGKQEAMFFGIDTLGDQGFAFMADTLNGLPISLAFKYTRPTDHSQINHPIFGDFDKDGKTDIVYNSSPSVLSLFIDEFNPSTTSFDPVYRFDANKSIDGHSVGDFDMDGKTDIVFGSIDGDVYVVEAQGVGTYQKVWQSTIPTYNAYLHFATHDIDGNGKPEFWVGGDAYYNGVGVTRFTCFETNGVNSYAPVAQIDLIGVFSFFAGNCFAKDIDNDGKEELFICIDQNVIILKFTGTPNHPAYDIFYLKQNELANSNSVYLGATLYDGNRNDKNELFITLDLVNNEGRKEFTYSYKPQFSMGVKASLPSSPSDFELSQNYPNPFNPTTTIEYSIPLNAFVSLKVFDLLGNVVATVINQRQNAGQHYAKFDGASIPSGIYFYRLRVANFVAVKKLILLK